MKKIGREMSILMGTTLSFCLSLVGQLASGHFAFSAFLVSFLVSLVVSLIIGFVVPMKPLSDALGKKLGLKPESFGTRCFDALISDLIYTPIITFLMVLMAYKQAVSHGAQIVFVPMFLKSLLLSLFVGYVLILLLMPVFLKFVLKRHAADLSGGPKDEHKDNLR